MSGLRASDFDFVLPPELIAQQPPPRRDQSRLMVVGRDAPGHHLFTELPALIEERVGPRALLVLNDTQVIPARLLGRKLDPGGAPGGQVELLLCEPVPDSGGGPGPGGTGWRETWRCLYRASKPLRPGTGLLLHGERPPAARVVHNEGSGRVLVELSGGDAGGLLAALERVGRVPLPPYIRHGVAAAEDRQRYQTLYARHPGAVAAPTAGLHFTEEVLRELSARGIERTMVTLHVGPGTFAPLSSDTVSEHVMHSERYHVPAETAAAIRRARAEGRKVLAVGTTVVRTLEAATQEGEGQTGPEAGPGQTRIFIYPPHVFRGVDALLTNFHLPRSTLLMLVSAFAGRRRVLSAYAEAVAQRYRFFSYGDAMLIPSPMEDP